VFNITGSPERLSTTLQMACFANASVPQFQFAEAYFSFFINKQTVAVTHDPFFGGCTVRIFCPMAGRLVKDSSKTGNIVVNVTNGEEGAVIRGDYVCYKDGHFPSSTQSYPGFGKSRKWAQSLFDHTRTHSDHEQEFLFLKGSIK
jgi:hypothetical protein